MADAGNVNTTNTGHCSTCGLDTDTKFTIQCEECKNWIHYLCSGLPLYLLLCLASTTRKYTCETCTFGKYADPEWTAEASDAIDRMRKEKFPQITPSLTNTGLSNPQTPPPLSPPCLTQDTDMSAISGDDLSISSTPEDMRLSQLPLTPLPQSQEFNSGGVETHGLSGDSNVAKPAPQTPATDNSQRKVPICFFYRKGICKHGPAGKECKFRHPKVCKKLANHGNKGELGCKLGRKCTMFHPMVCRNSQRRNECLLESCRFLHIKGTRRTAKEPPASTSSPRQGTTAPPPGLPPNTGSQNNNNEHFLGAVNGMRQDMTSLLRTMEAHTMLLSTLLKGNPTSHTQQTPQHQVLPWFNTINSH